MSKLLHMLYHQAHTQNKRDNLAPTSYLHVNYGSTARLRCAKVDLGYNTSVFGLKHTQKSCLLCIEAGSFRAVATDFDTYACIPSTYGERPGGGIDLGKREHSRSPIADLCLQAGPAF